MNSRVADYRKDQKQQRQPYSYQNGGLHARQRQPQGHGNVQQSQPQDFISISKQLFSFLAKCNAVGKDQIVHTKGDLVALDGHTSTNIFKKCATR